MTCENCGHEDGDPTRIRLEFEKGPLDGAVLELPKGDVPPGPIGIEIGLDEDGIRLMRDGKLVVAMPKHCAKYWYEAVGEPVGDPALGQERWWMEICHRESDVETEA